MKYPELTLEEKMDLIEDAFKKKEPIIFGYENDGQVKARVVVVELVALNQKNQPYVQGLDSLSGNVRSFTVDKMRTLHAWHSEGAINTDVIGDDGLPIQLAPAPTGEQIAAHIHNRYLQTTGDEVPNLAPIPFPSRADRDGR